MILVDTSVLSLAFRRKAQEIAEQPSVQTLRRLIMEDQPVGVPGIVLQELLSGVRSVHEFDLLLDLMEGFPLLLATQKHYLAAARIANACRRRGITISTVDCLIAAMAVEAKSPLLTTDRDFELMAPHCSLRLLE